MDAQHARQPVLPDAGGVHPQLQVWVDVSIQCHGFALVLLNCRILWGQRRLLLRKH